MSVDDLSINNKVQIGGLCTLLKKSETKLIESLNSQLNRIVIFNPKDWPYPSTVSITSCNLIIEYVDTDGTKNKLTKDNKCFAHSFIISKLKNKVARRGTNMADVSLRSDYNRHACAPYLGVRCKEDINEI